MFESRPIRRAALAAVILVLAMPDTGLAASCKASVRSIGASSPNESMAQWLAVSRWEFKVRKLYGTAYDNWDKAKNARFFCYERALMNSRGRNFTSCEAVGRPCKG